MAFTESEQSLRRVITALVKTWSAKPDRLNEASLHIVVSENRSNEEYEVALQNTKQAVDLERKSSPSSYKLGAHLNTLGVAYYRVGEFKKCRKTMEESNAKLDADDYYPSNQIFMAMAYAKLGDAEKAKALFDEVVKRAETSPLNSEDVGFLKEAKKVLGIEEVNVEQ